MQILVDIGMTLLILAAIPQLIKAYQNRKNLKDLSIWFFLLTLIGNIFTVVWCIIYHQWTILLLNLVYAIWSILTIYWIKRSGKNV